MSNKRIQLQVSYDEVGIELESKERFSTGDNFSIQMKIHRRDSEVIVENLREELARELHAALGLLLPPK